MAVSGHWTWEIRASRSPENACIEHHFAGRSRYTADMDSELAFILFLILPWAVAIAAYVFYRRRRKLPGKTNGSLEKS